MITYTIKEISNMFKVKASTLRYYEEIEILPVVERTDSGRRIYKENHINRLKTIFCFKGTGMSILKLKLFLSYEKNEEKHINDILTLLTDQKEEVQAQLLQLENGLKHVKKKVKYYTNIKKAIESETNLPSWKD